MWLENVSKSTIKISIESGQRQKALTLVMAALVIKLLLLDEHTAALDPKTSENGHDWHKDRGKPFDNLDDYAWYEPHTIEYGQPLDHAGKIVVDVKGGKKNLTVEIWCTSSNKRVVKPWLSDELVLG